MCILNNYDDYSNELFESENEDFKDEIKQYIKGNAVDISFLGNKKREEIITLIKYKSENDFNAGIGNTRLVIDQRIIETPNV